MKKSNKRRCIIAVAVLTVAFILQGCTTALSFSDTADNGEFKYAMSDKEAFVTVYHWDGTEEGKKIDIPAQIDGKKVVSVGGFFGRGLPMPFQIDTAEAFDDIPGEWLNQLPEGKTADETIPLVFTVNVPSGIEIKNYNVFTNYNSNDGKITAYEEQMIFN